MTMPMNLHLLLIAQQDYNSDTGCSRDETSTCDHLGHTATYFELLGVDAAPWSVMTLHNDDSVAKGV